MAKITISGQEDKKQPTTTQYPTTSTGAQGSMTGTNIFGSVIPNKVVVGAGTRTEPGTGDPQKNDPPVTSAAPGTGTSGGTETRVPNTTVKGGHGSFFGSTQNSEPTQTAEQKAATSLAQLRDDYSRALREQYNYSADRLKEERDAALRENWILQQQAEAALPEQMAAGGINGGANATSLAALKAMYQGNRNDIQSGYMDSLGDLQQQQSAEQAEAQRSYNERWLEYLLSLAKAKEGI